MMPLHNFTPGSIVIVSPLDIPHRESDGRVGIDRAKRLIVGDMKNDVLNGRIYKMLKESGRMGVPKTVVIIPFYNEIHKLLRSIQSLTSQTMLPGMVILVDDCGTEPLLPAIPETLEKAGIQCLVVRNPTNMGPGGSRQTGFALTPPDTDYVIFLDSDDFLSVDFIKECVRVHQLRPDIIATYGNSVNILDGKNRIHLNDEKYDNLLDGILNTRKWCTGALMWNFHQVRDIRWESYRCVEDSHFELSAALINPNIAYVDSATLYIEQSFESERLVRRNRNIRTPDTPFRHRLYDRLLKNYTFQTPDSKKKSYLKRTVHHWIRHAQLGLTGYLKTIWSFVLMGKANVAIWMVFYIPHFIDQYRRN